MRSLALLLAVAMVIAQVAVPALSQDDATDDFDPDAFRAENDLSNDDATDLANSMATVSENGEHALTVDSSGKPARVIYPPKCEDGPVKTILTKPGHIFWPFVLVNSCNGLNCPNKSPCLARKTVIKQRFVIVFKRFNCWGLIRYIAVGVKLIWFEDELKCSCKKCSDITSLRECVRTTPCPDETNKKTICYWRLWNYPDPSDYHRFPYLNSRSYQNYYKAARYIDPYFWGRCDCCEIKKCNKNQFFDTKTCSCRCKKIFRCRAPYVFDPNTCSCVCDTNFDCKNAHLKINPKTCKCECKPFFCFRPRIPNPKTCDCECPRKRCYPPFVWDPCSCDCVCKRVCKPPYVLDKKRCKCVCPPIKCPPYFEQDPKTCKCVCNRKCPKGQFLDPKTCTCKCIPIKCPPYYSQDPKTCKCVCDRKCPRGTYLDRDRCKCVGDCEKIYNKVDCEYVDSCVQYKDQNCRWFPHVKHGSRCLCECCQPTHAKYAHLDCGSYTPWGEYRCNAVNGCKWFC